MGIHGLTKLLQDECPEALKEIEIKSLTGRKVAIDASMTMYQFLIAVRQGSDGHQAQQLTNEAGEVTSHIQGMFNRTIRLLSNGIKPVFVFDGKPPTLKGGELAKRAEKRQKAETDLKAAQESGNTEDVDKFSKRLVRVTKEHNDDCKKLLGLMGVPVVEALCEAEAQCAELAAKGVVYGTATEDMDALTFKTPVLLRRLTSAASSKQPILEVDYGKLINGLELTHAQFIDMCILCGCDYTGSIKGIGPKKALSLIKQHKSIEEIVKHIDGAKYTIPNDWIVADAEETDEAEEGKEEDQKQPAKEEDDTKAPESSVKAKKNPMFVEARRLFVTPEVYPHDHYKLKWSDPDEAGLRAFLVDQMGFNAERVENGIKKLKDARGKTSQRRVDSFFTRVPAPPGQEKKRKAPEGKAGRGKKDAGKGKKDAGKGKKKA
ncbi:unnamed protein product [Chrysoparadoxa australica]